MRFFCKTYVIAAIWISATPAFSADPVRDSDAEMFPADVSYNPAIPTPDAVLGHALGEQPVRHHKLVEYITTVAGLSDRMSVEVIGYTHERRPILFLVVTSPENHARIDEIRGQHIALTEPDLDVSVDDGMPIVTWLNYGVHGAESSGMDASLPMAYYLAAAEGEHIERLLSQSVVLVTAIFNPDGHSKRVAWFDAFGGERIIADPMHIEHDFNWQLARTNHYWFDLNRQWLLVTQPESRAWMRKWHEWRPNLTVDYHEMSGGQTYYFHPGVASRTNPLVPDEAERLLAETIRSSEAFLDSEARLYFHGEDFDNYYIGKGSTFPLVNGGVGVLYEAGAALGRELDTPHGLRSYRENIRKHFRTGIASVEGGVNLRLEYLRYQKQFYEDALDAADDNAVKAYVFDAPSDPARLYHFVDLLNFHRIDSYALSKDISVNGEAYSAASAIIVPLAQPQFRLIRGLFDSVDEFEDPIFYDVSSWTMPLAFGLRYSALSGRNFNRGLAGELSEPVMPVASGPESSDYGYVFEWSGYYAPRALNRILEHGLLASVATEPFTASTARGDVALSRGSILIPFDRQMSGRSDITAIMRTIAAEDGITVYSLSSGRSATGTAGVNVGGPSFRPLKQPKVLMVVGDDINLYDAGEIWHLLDHRMKMPLTMRARDRLGDVDWSQYTHIVFPSGEYEEYEPEFSERLRLWVAEGGTVIGTRRAAQWVRDTVLDYVDPETADEAAEEANFETGSGHEELVTELDELERLNYEDKAVQEAVDVIGGAIFAGEIDITHPLGFGYVDRKIALHKNTDEVLARTLNPYASVIVYDTPPLLSGYTSAEIQQSLSGTAALVAERKGMGSVVLFADNPNFRGYWYGTNKLFLNALFFSTAFDAPVEEP